MILINLAAFQSSRGILQRNEKNGRKYQIYSFPDGTVQVPKSNELCATISELPRMIEEVVDLIEQWLKSWSGMY